MSHERARSPRRSRGSALVLWARRSRREKDHGKEASHLCLAPAKIWPYFAETNRPALKSPLSL
jgi:hypothetical protein